MQKYRARKGSYINDKDAEVIGMTVEKLSQKGGATADRFVLEAKKKTSPAHYLFDWNDERMARKYRESQARTYMASVTIEIKHVETRAFIPEPIILDFQEDKQKKSEKEMRAYLPIESILKNPNETDALLSKCKAEAFSWMSRWKQYVSLSARFNSVQKVFEAIEELDEAETVKETV